ncbi:MAG: hypothetical protein II649_06650 [Kiritimatiellae bacterium]|nr:hypothetical protein [Kiritimatiellia bacterium]
MNDNRQDGQTAFDRNHKPDFAKIEAHYAHAREKHPYFCDGLLPTQVPYPMTECAMLREIRETLRANRLRIERGIRNANCLWNELLNCEVWHGNWRMAVYWLAAATLTACVTYTGGRPCA